jgi:hypothetical protein
MNLKTLQGTVIICSLMAFAVGCQPPAPSTDVVMPGHDVIVHDHPANPIIVNPSPPASSTHIDEHTTTPPTGDTGQSSTTSTNTTG